MYFAFFNEHLPCRSVFFLPCSFKETQSEASPLTIKKPPSLTHRKKPNMTFYPLEQTQTEAHTCGICCESEAGVPHNSDFPAAGHRNLEV